MKQITDKEFYESIEKIIRGERSRAKLIKELETDSRTLNNKIQELVIYNPELYSRFIKKFPYRTKTRDDIDFEALAIEITKNGTTTFQASKKYNIGERTIRRRMKELAKENPYLAEIYNEVKENNKHSRSNSLELQDKISKLILRPVQISEINEMREKQLEEIERIFNKRCQIVSKEEAAKSMGMTANRVYKVLNELYRMRIERESKNQNFKDTLKFNSNDITIINTSDKEVRRKDKENERQPGEE